MTRETASSNDLLSMGQAAALLPGRPHTCTVFRWCKKGYRGIKLPYRKVGHRVFVARGDIEKFIEEVSAADRARYEAPPGQPPKVQRGRTPRQRERHLARADAILRRAGIEV